MSTMVMQPVSLSADQQKQYDDIRQRAAEVVDQPELWLAAPHPMLDAKSPVEFIARDEASLVIDLIDLIKEGGFS